VDPFIREALSLTGRAHLFASVVLWSNLSIRSGKDNRALCGSQRCPRSIGERVPAAGAAFGRRRGGAAAAGFGFFGFGRCGFSRLWRHCRLELRKYRVRIGVTEAGVVKSRGFLDHVHRQLDRLVLVSERS